MAVIRLCDSSGIQGQLTMTQSETNREYDGQDTENDESSSGTVSRRSTLAALAVLGLLPGIDTAGASSTRANTLATTLELGGSYSGSVNPGLEIAINSGKGLVGKTTSTGTNYDFGVIGRTNSEKGRGVAGFADNSTGKSIGLLGRNASHEGKGLEGFSDATTGNGIGVKGTAKAPNSRAIFGFNKAGSGDAYGGFFQSQSQSGIGAYGYASASSGNTVGVKGETNSADGWGLYTPDSAKIDGDLQVGGVKNFVQTVSTDAGQKQVAYTAVEAGDPQTEHSDVTKMEDGVAVVDLPDHFGMVTSGKEPLTVQVTPYCEEKVHPQVTDTSTERIVVKDFGDGPDEYTFSYTIKGIRLGFEDQEVVRDP